MKFEGQVLSIFTTGTSGAVVESPEIVNLEGRKFICGVSIRWDDEGQSWTTGLRTWIPIDLISHITEFPTIKEYQRRVVLHKKQQAGLEARNRKVKKPKI
jgi:hypothetical protein